MPETGESPNFRELSVRLAAFGRRVFAEFGLGGVDAAVGGVGLSIEDFVANVLLEYLDGRIAHEGSQAGLFSHLATALRNDIVDALRRAAHSREEIRSHRREQGAESQPAGLDELPAATIDPGARLDEAFYRRRTRALFQEEPDLASMVDVVLDLGLQKPQEIAEALRVTASEVQNRKKRLRRRLVEYQLVEARFQ